ncbi:TPA: hypothetical protein ACGU88_000908 [Vibrio vulnificus]|uniref:hypothetical protein n=1 Tax=Vibrio vulnificus TaxID=672 RepID=UPI002893681D|nr:hypothetical protein [Vibrio vulnificus]WNJ72088.1 hypothetical protein RI132_20350 [Vibrio vulnificus]
MATKSYDTPFHSQPDSSIPLTEIITKYGVSIAKAITGMSDRSLRYHVDKFQITIPKKADTDLRLGVLVMKEIEANKSKVELK